MGGHGGLNILPQKRWNVYNYENREKVRRDEEAAAREEQLNREQARRRDAESRLDRLRSARGLVSTKTPSEELAQPIPSEPEPLSPIKEDSHHINLFEGIRIFDPIRVPEEKVPKERSDRQKKKEVRVITAEDEKYKLGYGVAGKGVKMPWYMEKKASGRNVAEELVNEDRMNESNHRKRKKTIDELREERLTREKREKERTQQLLRSNQFPRDGENRRREERTGNRYVHPRLHY